MDRGGSGRWRGKNHRGLCSAAAWGAPWVGTAPGRCQGCMVYGLGTLDLLQEMPVPTPSPNNPRPLLMSLQVHLPPNVRMLHLHRWAASHVVAAPPAVVAVA